MVGLLDIANEAAEESYSPYSSNKVGAAIKTTAGTTYKGCNIENKNIPNSYHAIEVALVEAIKNSEYDFEQLAVTRMPCGTCLETLSEFCESDFSIVFTDDSGEAIESNLGSLLPHSRNQS